MSRYSEAHKAPTGPGDARPTAMQIIQDEGLEGNMKDKVRRPCTQPVSALAYILSFPRFS